MWGMECLNTTVFFPIITKTKCSCEFLHLTCNLLQNSAESTGGERNVLILDSQVAVPTLLCAGDRMKVKKILGFTSMYWL